jgi:serine O-acetyltransferase
VIGHDSVIGGNVFITKSVPANTRVSVKNQELITQDVGGEGLQKQELTQDEVWYYVI